MPTIQQTLLFARTRLEGRSSSASLDAQVLLCDALHQPNRAYLFTHPEHVLTAEEAERFASYLARREQGEPVAYIRGHKAWYDRTFWVNPSVLIPRPETELVLETALACIPTDEARMVADVGTGSGALAVTFKALRPHCTVYATDISAEALAVAQRNATEHATPIAFLHGNLLEPLIARGLRLDMVISNPPYIATEVLPKLAVSAWEPRLALDGGEGARCALPSCFNKCPMLVQQELGCWWSLAQIKGRRC
ncbi:MAG UNVERIFIED_CONTAM: peptide chain release factor N(5)-glutamine methyltransferase [Anaerolineae bacterium]|jgi:release factor glutamine methyltransferase